MVGLTVEGTGAGDRTTTKLGDSTKTPPCDDAWELLMLRILKPQGLKRIM
jgi:hypothetical protein